MIEDYITPQKYHEIIKAATELLIINSDSGMTGKIKIAAPHSQKELDELGWDMACIEVSLVNEIDVDEVIATRMIELGPPKEVYEYDGAIIAFTMSKVSEIIKALLSTTGSILGFMRFMKEKSDGDPDWRMNHMFDDHEKKDDDDEDEEDEDYRDAFD